MEKTITLGDKEIRCRCNSMTLRLYKLAFNEDFLILFLHAGENDRSILEMLPTIQKFAFVVAKQAESNGWREAKEKINEDEFYDWVEQFEDSYFIKSMKEIIDMWRESAKQESESKN